jgi:hypothetical protein
VDLLGRLRGGSQRLLAASGVGPQARGSVRLWRLTLERIHETTVARRSCRPTLSRLSPYRAAFFTGGGAHRPSRISGLGA